VHQFLKEEGVRDRLTVIASGGIRNPHDVAKAIALGADGVCTGTADLVALECIRCHKCESGRGCARGIATTDAELMELIQLEWGKQRIVNMFLAWRRELIRILKRLGMKSIKELVGRTDCLTHIDYMKKRA
jgi:glutamate synthase domain-containing protein 2